MAAEAYLQLLSRVATGQGEKLWKTCEAGGNIDADEDETGITPYMLDRGADCASVGPACVKLRAFVIAAPVKQSYE